MDFFTQSISDLEHTWPISLSIIFISLIISVLVMLFIRTCGGCIVISVIVLYFSALTALGIILMLASYDRLDIGDL